MQEENLNDPESLEFLQKLHGNWKDKNNYPNEKSSINEWCWEFLKRNKEFQKSLFEITELKCDFYEMSLKLNELIVSYGFITNELILENFHPLKSFKNQILIESPEIKTLNLKYQIEKGYIAGNYHILGNEILDINGLTINIPKSILEKSTQTEIIKTISKLITSYKKEKSKKKINWTNALQLYDFSELKVIEKQIPMDINYYTAINDILEPNELKDFEDIKKHRNKKDFNNKVYKFKMSIIKRVSPVIKEPKKFYM